MWTGTLQDEEVGRELVIDNRGVGEAGPGIWMHAVREGFEGWHSVLHRPYEPLGMTGIKLRKCCPVSP